MSIPVLLLSAKAQAKDIAIGMDAGADAYLTKPFEPLDLLEKVAALLGGTPDPDRRSRSTVASSR